MSANKQKSGESAVVRSADAKNMENYQWLIFGSENTVFNIVFNKVDSLKKAWKCKNGLQDLMIIEKNSCHILAGVITITTNLAYQYFQSKRK